MEGCDLLTNKQPPLAMKCLADEYFRDAPGVFAPGALSFINFEPELKESLRHKKLRENPRRQATF